jgi:hypothetical protein
MALTPYFQPLHPQVVEAVGQTQVPMVLEVLPVDQVAEIVEPVRQTLVFVHLVIPLLFLHLKALMVVFIVLLVLTTVLVAEVVAAHRVCKV